MSASNVPEIVEAGGGIDHSQASARRRGDLEGEADPSKLKMDLEKSKQVFLQRLKSKIVEEKFDL